MIRRVLAVSAAAVVLACSSDSTAPKAKPFQLTLDVSDHAFTIASDSTGPYGVSCAFTISGNASGSGSAVWKRLTFKVYTGADRATPAFVDTIAGNVTLGAYGPLSAGSDYATRWTLSFNRPFYIDITHVFARAGQTQEDSVQTHAPCGQAWSTPTPPGSASFANIVFGNAANLAPGGTMDVTYTLNSPAGAWRSDVLMSGACSADVVISEGLQFSITRTVRVPIPANCTNVASLRASVVSIDAAGRGVGDTARPPSRLRDSVPPAVSLALDTDSTAAASIFASPTLVQGGVAYLRMTSSDSALARLAWAADPIGARDSVVLTGKTDARTIALALPTGFTGALAARASAVDTSGNRATTPDQTQQVLPFRAGTTVSTTLLGAVFDLIVDDAHDRVYVLGRGPDGSSTELYAYSATTLALVDSTLMPNNTLKLILSSDGSALFAYQAYVHYARVSLTAPKLGYTMLDSSLIYLRNGRSTIALANGTLLIGAIINGSLTPEIVAVDVATGAMSLRTDITRMLGGTLVASADGRMLFVRTDNTVWTRYDVLTGQQVGVSAPEFLTQVPEPDATGSRLRVGTKVLDVLTSAASTLTLSPSANAVPGPLSPDWATQYLAFRNGVVGLYQTGSGTLTSYLGIPRSPSTARVSSQGRRLAMLYDTGGAPILTLLALP